MNLYEKLNELLGNTTPGSMQSLWDAANEYAGTVDLDTLGALNRKAGRVDLKDFLAYQAILDELGGAGGGGAPPIFIATMDEAAGTTQAAPWSLWAGTRWVHSGTGTLIPAAGGGLSGDRINNGEDFSRIEVLISAGATGNVGVGVCLNPATNTLTASMFLEIGVNSGAVYSPTFSTLANTPGHLGRRLWLVLERIDATTGYVALLDGDRAVLFETNFAVSGSLSTAVGLYGGTNNVTVEEVRISPLGLLA